MLMLSALPVWARSVVFTSVQTHGLQSARLLCPWNFPDKNAGVGCHFLLQGTFWTQGSNLHLPHWQPDSLPLSHQGTPIQYPKPKLLLTMQLHMAVLCSRATKSIRTFFRRNATRAKDRGKKKNSSQLTFRFANSLAIGILVHFKCFHSNLASITNYLLEPVTNSSQP